VDVQTRIENQQKRLDLGIAAHEFTREIAQPFQENLNHIKEQFDRMKARGPLTPKETETLNHMLDENSDKIYRAKQTFKNPSLKY
jgi:hypothetical protein